MNNNGVEKLIGAPGGIRTRDLQLSFIWYKAVAFAVISLAAELSGLVVHLETILVAFKI